LTSSSLLVVGGALAFVLGLLVVTAAMLRRFAPRASGGGEGRIDVVSRVGLGPRQGVATLRIQGRMALVSYGEGGVRLLMELDADAPAARGGTVDVTVAGDEDRAAFQAALSRAAGKFPGLRALMLGVTLALVVPASVSGQDTVPPAARQATPAAQEPGGAGQEASSAAEVRQQQRLDTRANQRAAASGPTLPDVKVSVGGGDDALQLSGPVGTVLFVGALTLLPTLLLLMTSFTRILIVLHLLKQALGTQTAPPAHLLAAMALILTGFVMSPTLEAANDRALAPWMAGEIDSGTMLREASVPFRAFMLHTTREQDLAQFVQMSGKGAPSTVDELPLVTLTAAFVTSELTSAFQMGFALFLPFLVIDVVVASVLMSMGMFMLPPVMVSLPFKLLLFVLVDGWSLVMGSLVQSFA
jgi:flagellar biosynthetic protein FliP